ncbi:MAG TPA: response regulator [Terracidiphilus sp.]
MTFLAVDGPRRAGIFPLTYGESEGQAAEKPRILIVDDERLLAETTATILRRAGFNARTAYDGFHALETANAFHPEYLLTDIMMPAMNGVELAIAVIRMFPATRILLFSGQAGISNIMEESRSRGFEFPLLAKPVHPTQLIDSLKALKES